MEELNQKTTLYNFIKRYVIHALAIWLFVNIVSWLQYLYAVKLNLAYSVNKDGSLVSEADRFINQNFHQPLCLWILTFTLLAEINFLLTTKSKKLSKFVIYSILLGIAGGAISLLYANHTAYYPLIAEFISSSIAITGYVAGYVILFSFVYDKYRQAKYYRQKSESELHLLKAQINPHFFFNTLNNIYGIALSENAAKTAGSIELLGDMMRYNMNGMREHFITLEAELKFIENYLALQQLRIPQKSNISINTNIEHPEPGYKIAPMLLIPLVENALKYGISMDSPCFIKLDINVEKNWLMVVVENSIWDATNTEKGAGLGVANVQQRLQLLYPGKHKFSIEHYGKKYRVMLSVMLQYVKERRIEIKLP